MENIGKIVRYNLGAMLFYTLLVCALSGGDGAFLGALIALIHAGSIFFIGLLIAIFGKDKESSTTAEALIFSALLIGVIGFSVCLGTLSFH